MNQNFNKEARIKHLEITFLQYQENSNDHSYNDSSKPNNFDIKFPLYMKHLRSLKLTNICDKNFTETLFDMASCKKLKMLSLSMVNDQ